MDCTNLIKKSHFSCIKLTKIIKLILFLPIAATVLSLLFKDYSHSRNHHNQETPSTAYPFHPSIKIACSETLHSSLCLSTLSAIPTSNTTFLTILEFAINRTVVHVKTTREDIADHRRDLNAHEKNALRDCMDMLDQTTYELQQAIDQLCSSRTRRRGSSYGNIKTLLSAAMTNENTCVNGFSDLEELDLDSRNGHRERIQNLLTPISNMISNNLALIKHVENKRARKIVKKRLFSSSARRVVRRRKKNVAAVNLRVNVTVSHDGSGNFTSIGEAIEMAPNMSGSTYVIKINAGVYEENVMVPREKMNVMFIGDGMNSTVITGSRNFVDGFSTFESATLTVVGDKFLARDLTIRNTAPPEKHQAVALRVTSNAAFYRCQIVSHQDTLYAHSLRQFYQHCTIEGTVDFIFGNAAAVFQNCTILVRKPIPGQRNMITAQGREDPNQNTGISLQNCTIEAAQEFNLTDRRNFSTFLGRPWRNYSRTAVVNSYLGDLIHPRGWFEWDRYSKLDTVEYIEYMNSGPGADTRHRVSWAGYRKNCTNDMVRQFGVAEFLHGADDWLESTVLPLFGDL